MKRLTVLMLGWEFPPVISGGLGIACYGICKALSRTTKLHVILPRMQEQFNIPEANIIGIGNLNLDETFERDEIKHFEKIIKKEKIEINISPYPARNPSIILEQHPVRVIEKTKTKSIQKIHNRFKDAELYGSDIISLVKYYSEIAQKLASRIKFDIIHAHDWMTFFAGIHLKEKFNKPLVLHVHSLNYDRIGPINEGWIYQLEREALNKADLIIPVSNYTGRIIQEHYGITSEKIRPIHNGIDPIKSFKTEKKFPEKLVLFLGRITLQKGPEYFLETAYHVIQRYPNVRFAIAGTGDKLRQIIEEGAYKEISHKLHFTGFIERDKVHSLLSMADVFCMPSLSEPFGLTALEAVQFGVPVVITKRSGAAEVLKSALLADFWDTELMAKHIVNLLTNEKLHAKKVKEGKNEIKNLTWESTATNILNEYKKIIS